MKLSSLTRASILAMAALAIAPSAMAQAVKERIIKWGHLTDPGNPINLGVVRFAELVEKKSGGKMKIREFGSSQLGNEMQQQGAIRGGTQDIFTGSLTSLTGLVKDFGILDLPFTFKTVDSANAVMDGPFGELLLKRLAEKDIIGLAYWDLGGFRSVTNSKRPINKLEDFNGLKLRVIGNPVYLETFKVLGANPVPMSFAEVYQALESKAIDGQENPVSVIRSAKIFEVQKYLSLTNHTYTINLVQVGKKFWDSLSPDEQRIMREAAAESLPYQRQMGADQARSAIADLKAAGMQVNEVAPAEMERMRAATKPVADKFLPQYDPEVVRVYQAEVAKINR
jgi:tripartite ATP-independent transporter DctP family solute receptor